MKLILTADLHLGRSSTGLPPSVSARHNATTCREAWERIVNLAVEESAEAVLVAGDLIEESRAYYESLGTLVDGFKTLQAHGIHFFAVAGNHDARAFERIAMDCADMEGINFVGRGGKWQRVAIENDGRKHLFIDGWSFPDHRHPTDPTDTYDLERNPGAPVIGLLHTDLGNSTSPYAPTTPGALRRLPPDFWLLGHIHKPSRFDTDGDATILYPGSPQAMDFGETGWHGVWELATETMQLRRHQTSTIRYENSLQVMLRPDDGEEAVSAALKEAAMTHISDLHEDERGALAAIIHRATLRGEWKQVDPLETLTAKLPEFDLPEHEGLKAGFDGRLEDRTELPLNLENEERRGGAIGRLAGRLIVLKSDDWEECSWFKEIQRELMKEYQGCRIEGDDEVRDDGQSLFGPPTPKDLRGSLAAQARHLLVAARKEVS